MSDRAEFESTVRATWGDSYSFMRDTDGHYCDDVLDGMWWAWQAARAQAVPEGFGSPAEATLGGCRCVLFGENNRHWPCPIHNSAAPQPPQEGE